MRYIDLQLLFVCRFEKFLVASYCVCSYKLFYIVLLQYLYLEEYCKAIPIDISKQQKLDADSKAIKEISFAGN